MGGLDVAEESAARTSCALDDDAAFTWGADVKQIEQELRSEKEAEMVKQRDDFAREIDNAKVKLQADIGIQVQQLKD